MKDVQSNLEDEYKFSISLLVEDSVWGNSDTVLKMTAPSSIAGHQVHQSAVASLMSTHHPNSLRLLSRSLRVLLQLPYLASLTQWT